MLAATCALLTGPEVSFPFRTRLPSPTPPPHPSSTRLLPTNAVLKERRQNQPPQPHTDLPLTPGLYAAPGRARPRRARVRTAPPGRRAETRRRKHRPARSRWAAPSKPTALLPPNTRRGSASKSTRGTARTTKPRLMARPRNLGRSSSRPCRCSRARARERSGSLSRPATCLRTAASALASARIAQALSGASCAPTGGDRTVRRATLAASMRSDAVPASSRVPLASSW